MYVMRLKWRSKQEAKPGVFSPVKDRSDLCVS